MNDDSILDGFKNLHEAMTLGFGRLEGKVLLSAASQRDALAAMLARVESLERHVRALERRACASEARLIELERRAGLAPPRPADVSAAIARIERDLEAGRRKRD